MLGIDTNVLVRFLVRDDEPQYEKARRLIRHQLDAGEPVFVSHLVLIETEWVLRSRYGIPKEAMIAVIAGLLDSLDVQLEDEPSIEAAVNIWRESTAGFVDCLVGVRNQRLGCTSTATFDAKALKMPGFIKV